MYPEGINPTVNDEYSESVATAVKDAAINIMYMERKIYELGSRLRNNAENDRSCYVLGGIMNDIELFKEDINENTQMINDAMEEEMRHIRR
jgi:hypothetical protein